MSSPERRESIVLEMTQTAIDVIKHIAPGDAGLRVYTAGAPDSQALQVEIAEAPRVDDQVVEAGGAQVFLEPRAADTLDDKVLDAVQDERGVHFSVVHQDPPGWAPGEAGS
jgi:Fe-S cluster assembly iron-binding protein IscA